MEHTEVSPEPPLIQGLPCTEDPKWEPGCFWDQLGQSKWLCPCCGKHINQKGVCLTGCQLSGPGMRALMTLTVPSHG